MDAALSAIGETVRLHDPDRFLATLFAPPERREALFTLYAFNHEIARAREVTSEPMLALIRLQWWREVVEGAPRRHEVATPLAALLQAGMLRADDLLAMIEGRESEAAEAIPTTDALRDYAGGTAGRLAVAAGRLLGAEEAERSRLMALGTGYGLAGILRRFPALAREGRCLLPEDILAAQGMSRQAAMADPGAVDLAGLAGVARETMAEGQGAMRRAVIAAALPAVLARRDLVRSGAAPRGLGDRLAVVAAYALGRV